MKFTASTALRWFGFRRTLIVNALISGAFMASYALFTSTTPHWVIFLALLAGGFFRSLEFTALNAICYADIDPAADEPRDQLRQRRRSRCPARSASRSPRSASSSSRSASATRRSRLAIFRSRSSAWPLISSLSTFIFARLKPDAGAALSAKPPVHEEGAPAPAE